MRLSKILGPEIFAPTGTGDIEITGLSSDSRTVRPGVVFAAMPGTKADGGRFIADAAAKGAVAILAASSAEIPPQLGKPILLTEEPRRALAMMAARYYGRQPPVIVAVTGTSGKTSVAEFTRQIFASLGHNAASLGTIGIVKPGGALYGSLTTPDPISLHATLAGLYDEGVTHLAMEASSHGLDQHRLDGVHIAAAAFTNLGRDHLDYHPTIEAYFAAKLRLFTELLQPGQRAVVNIEGEYGQRVRDAARRRGLDVITVGPQGDTLRLTGVTRDGFAQIMHVVHDGRSYDVRLPLVGAYQVANALVAAGQAIAIGTDVESVLAALGSLKGVKGRLDIVGTRNGGLGVVDYAHKPEALIAALEACRPFATGKLICVFGCGGNRDAGKRPIMGRIAVERADVTIVTDDNPRNEVPSAIRSEIMSGARGAREIGDRAQAIQAAVAMMGAGDVVLVAGKGHETGQIVGDTVLPFSDHDVLKAALSSW